MEMKIIVNGKAVACKRPHGSRRPSGSSPRTAGLYDTGEAVEPFINASNGQGEKKIDLSEHQNVLSSKSPFVVRNEQRECLESMNGDQTFQYTVTIDATPHTVTATMIAYDPIKREARFLINDRMVSVTNITGTLATSLSFFLGNKTITCATETNDVQPASSIPQPLPWTTPGNKTAVVSPLAGRVISVLVQPAVMVTKGQPLVIIESMKMENEICAPCDAFIKTISITPGNLVQTNQVLVTFDLKGEFNATTKSNHGQTAVSDW